MKNIKKAVALGSLGLAGVVILGAGSLLLLDKLNVITPAKPEELGLSGKNSVFADYEIPAPEIKPGKYYLFGDTSKRYYEITEDGYIQLKNADYRALATVGCPQRVLDILNGKAAKDASKEEIDDITLMYNQMLKSFKDSYKFTVTSYNWKELYGSEPLEKGVDFNGSGNIVKLNLNGSDGLKSLTVTDEKTLRFGGTDPETGKESVYILVD